MRQRVVIDGRWIGETGLGRYVDELVRALASLDHGFELVVLMRPALAPPDWAAGDHVALVEVDIRWFEVKEQVLLPHAIRTLRPALTHFTNFNVPLMHQGPFVATIHDLTLLDHPTARPSTSHRARSLVMSRVMARAARRAEIVLAPSEYVAGEIRRRLGASRVTVTPEAPVDLPPAAALDHLEIGGGYALTVGKSYPHKNLDRLLEAVSLVRRAWPEFELVSVGPTDAHREAFAGEVVRRGLEGVVHVVSDASDAELAALYEGAEMFVFPSLSEGFGLPGLEAMSMGTPVAAARRTCLPEVYGEAAVYFDPTDVSDIATTIVSLHQNPAERAQLSDAGRTRVAEFTWQRTAELTLGAYRSAIERSARRSDRRRLA